MKKILPVLMLAMLGMAGCLGGTAPGNTIVKPKYLWFDAEANFERFATRDSIDYYLDKAAAAGFNQIVVDVKSVQGDVLYQSAFMPQLTELNGVVIERDWDYLRYFIDGARARDLKVTVSTTIFPLGRPVKGDGPAYRGNEFDGRLCLEYTPGGYVGIKDDPRKVAAFLNPAMPENKEYAMRFIRELVTNYDFEGYALDYCRYPDLESDFSEFSRAAFEEYTGEKIENFPGDIFTYGPDGERIPGKYYQKWWEFRSMVIHDFVKSAKEEIKAVRPEVKLEYWAASWINALYANGQNWTSKRHDFTADPVNTWASPEYSKTGFAEHLDVFLLGTYLDIIRGADNPESIEFGIKRAYDAIDGDCEIYGTIYAKNHAENIEDAVYLCLTQSGGLMVFDIIQVIESDLWDDIRRGIDRAEKEY